MAERPTAKEWEEAEFRTWWKRRGLPSFLRTGGAAAKARKDVGNELARAAFAEGVLQERVRILNVLRALRELQEPTDPRSVTLMRAALAVDEGPEFILPPDGDERTLLHFAQECVQVAELKRMRP